MPYTWNAGGNMKLPLFILFFIGVRSTSALAEPVYFLVAEPPRTSVHGDSYVLPLSQTKDIAHARDLITRGSAAGETIIFARIAAGADGLNADFLKSPPRAWSW